MRHFLLLVILVLCLSGCRDKVICPAFQSAYILDDSVRMTYYSYLWKLDADERNRYLASQKQASAPTVATADTTGLSSPLDSGVVVASAKTEIDYFAYLEPRMPDPEQVRKNKNGIIKTEPYWIKNYKLRTAPKENVLTPPVPEEEEDSAFVDQGQFLASDFNDSTGNDEPVLTGVAPAVDSTSLVIEEDTSFVIPTLAVVEPAKPKTELQFRYGYDPNDKELNVEQAYYNKHFGQYLYRRVPVKQEEPAATGDDETVEEESKGGLFKNLFGKKKKNKKDEPVDDEVIEEPPLDEEVIEEDPNSGF